jgi:hypothetical protein
MFLDQRLSHRSDTLHYSESTLSLRPRAAATKNKMRMAENTFIFLIGVKKYPRGGSILQILLSSVLESNGILMDSNFHIHFICERQARVPQRM